MGLPRTLSRLAVAAAVAVAIGESSARGQTAEPPPAPAPLPPPPPPHEPVGAAVVGVPIGVPLAPLPFAIASEKRLDGEELDGKKEGTFVTGLPDFSVDPLNGVGLGGEGYITYDGSRDDPFFAYAPYRSRVSVAAFVTTKSQWAIEAGLDVPYLFDSPWRLRTVAAFQRDPNQLYFGRTTGSLRHLRALSPALSPYAGLQPSGYSSYADHLATVRAGGPGEAGRVADTFYDYFTLEQALVNVSVERSILKSKVRLVAGIEIAYVDVSTYDGRDAAATDPATGNRVTVPNGATRLEQDSAAGRIRGVGHGFVDIAQVGAVYDTRDFEPDPTRGIFAEVTNELSFPEIGSRFTFDKVFGQIKAYQKVFSYDAQRLVLAGRIGAGGTIGADAPFFEYQDEWSTEGSIEGLGGFHTLRGYKQARFLARMMGFANAELRYRFARFSLLSQGFGLMLVPFVDAGGVWNGPDELTVDNLRISGGAGLRVAWNQSTIVSFDYGLSEEDHQLFIQLGHAF